MGNKIKIYKNQKDDTYAVQAISIQKGDGYLYIPSPFGKETMVFNSLDEAVAQVANAGYEYSLVNSEIMQSKSIASNKIDYDKIVDVLVKNLCHENIEVRTSAINSLSKFGIEIADRLIEILKTDKHWLTQQSIVKCMEKIISENKNAAQIFLPSLIETSESEFTMVKSAALKAIEKICDLKKEL